MAHQEEEDPFGVFGDDDDDDDELVQENETSRIARSLVEAANQKAFKSVSTQTKTEPSPSDQQDDLKRHEFPEISSLKPLSLPWPRPLYLGPIILVSSLPYGGGRGYCATRDLAPGTLVLVEQPVVTWPEGQAGEDRLSLAAVNELFLLSDANSLIHQLEHFHPTKHAVDQDPESNPIQIAGMLTMLHSHHQDQLQSSVDLASEKGITNADGSPVGETDVLRVLLALRYNGLESGVYLHVAMLNHADQPNCVKFMPIEKPYSEVRTTKAIRAGEPLTISYVPRIVSHASRRKHLWEQHRFDIGADLPTSLRKMELIGNKLPVSSINKWDENSTTNRIETATSELEDLRMDLTRQAEQGTLTPESMEQAKALEQTAQELYTEAVHQLKNESHLLLIPCLRLHLDSCDLVQRDSSLTASQRKNLLGRLVNTARKLLVLENLLLGPDHFALARTSLDLSQAIEELLSSAPKQLISLRLIGLSTVSEWSTLEYRSRRDYERIRALYPHDTEELMESKGR